MSTVRFETSDFFSGLPPAGTYRGTIRSAQLRESREGNRMVEVVVSVEAAGAAHDVRDYFVLEGASPRGLCVARARLVELYRACGLDPQSGDEIRPEDLEGATLEVKVRHEERDGQVRLRIVGYRPLEEKPSDDDTPF